MIVLRSEGVVEASLIVTSPLGRLGDAPGETSMTEEKNTLAQLFAACWKDEALKARFMADPKAVLAEYGMPVPEGMDVKVVENSDSHVHITMPAPPAEQWPL